MQTTKIMERIEDVLKKSRTMSYEQALYLGKDVSKKEQKHAITVLFKKGMLFYSKHRDYIMTNPIYKPDKRMEKALWIILKQIDGIDTKQIYQPEAPATIGYVKPHRSYEIVSTNNDRELKEAVSAINERYKETNFNNDVIHTRYILVVSHKDYINMFKGTIEFPYVFAVVTSMKYGEKLEVPDVDYYIPDNDGDGEVNE